ncbi:MAG: hypothetical protein QM288_02935 [Bacteroidota bacterium]|nr:hypothetical protein [Bacteroidota bacterium]
MEPHYKKSLLLVLAVLLFRLNLFSQKELDIWYFGNKAGISFVNGGPIALLNNNEFIPGYSSTISDSSGNLLFYGQIRLLNRNHTLMPNGDLGTTGEHGMIGIQTKIPDTIYYIFHVDGFGFPNPSVHEGLTYSILNMNLDNGLGDIEPSKKSIPLCGASQAFGCITATRHSNNHDAWIISRIHDPDSNFYVSYLLNDNGVVDQPVFSNSGVFLDYSISTMIQALKISQDGKHLVCCYSDRFEVCSFNTATGEIQPKFTIIPSYIPVGPCFPDDLAFSVDGKFVYVACHYYCTAISGCAAVFQYNMERGDSLSFKDSEKFIAIGSLMGIHLGPDNKIYATQTFTDSLSVIHHPSLPGSACQWQKNYLSLQGRQSGIGLSQGLQRYFAYINHSGQCQGMPVSFSPNTYPAPDSLWWNFGDPASGSANTSIDSTPQHIYTNSGSYTIQMIVKHIDNRYDTAIFHLFIEPQPIPNLGPDITVCENQAVILDAGYNPEWTYLWNTGATSSSITVDTSGTYSVTVSSQSGCSGSDSINVFIGQGTKPPPRLIKHD